MRLAVLFLSFALLLQQAPATNGAAPALPAPVVVRLVTGRPYGPARADLYRM